MAMTASSRAPESAGTQESERSPFARLTELLAPYQPGKPLIALSLGEPQHPVPEAAKISIGRISVFRQGG